MSDFLSTGTLPDHYEQLAKTVRDFAQSVVAPVAAQHDADHSFPYEVVSGMADMGLFGLPFPEEYGGMGGDYFALCLALEELGKVDQSVAITLEAGVSLGAMPVYRFGNEAQKQEWLPQLTSGRALAAFGLTEPGGGSDAGATKTTARLDDGHWVINGSKQFITNSGTDITKLISVTAVTGSTGDRKEISSILVPVPSPGFTAGPAYNKVGWNASDTHPLSFDDVRVPENVRIRRQQRETLIHNSVVPADRSHVAIPAAIRKAAVLYSHRFDVRFVDQGRQLQSVHIADPNHARTAGVVDRLNCAPDFPILGAQAGMGIRTMEEIRIDTIGFQILQRRFERLIDLRCETRSRIVGNPLIMAVQRCEFCLQK